MELVLATSCNNLTTRVPTLMDFWLVRNMFFQILTISNNLILIVIIDDVEREVRKNKINK